MIWYNKYDIIQDDMIKGINTAYGGIIENRTLTLNCDDGNLKDDPL